MPHMFPQIQIQPGFSHGHRRRRRRSSVLTTTTAGAAAAVAGAGAAGASAARAGALFDPILFVFVGQSRQRWEILHVVHHF